MSWEGYQQNICTNGHYYENDGNGFDGMFATEPLEEPTCPICNAKCAWWNIVDTTNGSFNIDSYGNETQERIDGYIEPEEKTPAEYCTCSECGNNHTKTLATYKIPETGGHRVV